MSYSKYPAGSEWRKWDLHVHTPCSILHREFGNDWDLYVKKLFRKALDEQIATIGITDYYLIEGYEKLTNEYLNNDIKLKELLFTDEDIRRIKEILILPNIEFRVDQIIDTSKSTGKPNFHVIFSNTVSIKEIITDFLSQIQLEYATSPHGQSDTLSLCKDNLIKIGKLAIKENGAFKDKEPLFVGTTVCYIDPEEVKNTLLKKRNIFEGKYLIGIPVDEDYSKLQKPNQGYLIRKSAYELPHFYFVSNSKSIEYAKETQKPCIWGSDAHDFEKLFKPTKDRYTWLKADPTFEGLKQILYEPKDRPFIGPNKPPSKTSYLVIDKVRFIDKSGKFSPEWIYLNENLNSIIGGKSSGKSLLLYLMAKTIDDKQVKDREKDIPIGNYSDLCADIDFEVVWKNNKSNKLNDIFSDNEISGNQITYIPQLYVNYLAEKKGKEHLNQLINNILEQDESYKGYFEDKKEKISNLRIKIRSLIDKLFKTNDDYQDSEDKLNEIGNLEKINLEISNLEIEINSLKENSNLDQSEHESYEKTTRIIEEIEEELLNLKNSDEAIYDLQLYFTSMNQEIITQIREKREEYTENIMEETIKELLAIYTYMQDTRFEFVIKEIIIMRLKLKEKIDFQESELERKRVELEPLRKKIANQDQLEILNDNLEIEKGKRQRYITETNNFKKLKLSINKIEDDLKTSYEELHQEHLDIEKELGKYNKHIQPIELRSSLIYNMDQFSSFLELFNLRYKMKEFFGEIFNTTNTYAYTPNIHVENIFIIFKKLKEYIKNNEWNKKYLKAGTHLNDLYYKLFDDYFEIEYKLIYNNDEFLKMSPGKRGLVLLELILHLSNARHPILIDQPEDNLDNRTVYNDLKNFILEKKNLRQIIMVTHNPNLVVSTDSENIIVANQDGQKLNEKENRKYIFEYVSGSLEHTFKKANEKGILYKYGIREHVCDILEGGEEAFCKRERKYDFKKEHPFENIPMYADISQIPIPHKKNKI